MSGIGRQTFASTSRGAARPGARASAGREGRGGARRARAARRHAGPGAAHGVRGRALNEPSRLYGRLVKKETGGDLLSQALASQVPSALRGLTALFGMGRGVSPAQLPPEICQDRATVAIRLMRAPREGCPSGRSMTASRSSARAFKTAQPTNKRASKNIRQALDPLVPVSYVHCCTSRSGLSTWWSTRDLTLSRRWVNSSRGRLPA
jgi:hypothetical protein